MWAGTSGCFLLLLASTVCFVPSFATSNYPTHAQTSSQQRAARACEKGRALHSSDPHSNASVPFYLDSSSPLYINRTEVNWSSSCWENATCIISPRDTTAVSQLMKILEDTGSKFAIRSGGHNSNRGFASIGGSDGPGVLLDLSNIDSISLSPSRDVVSIGGGQRWENLYSQLDDLGLYANGPKDPRPGAGTILGGGIVFLASQYGLAANGLANVEVVLSNSTIVNANATNNPDLWWAIKGGGNNFGIVTRYDIEVVQAPMLWYEFRVYDSSQREQLFDALVAYQSAAESDDKSGIIFQALTTGNVVGFTYAAPTQWPTVFAAFQNIPYQSTLLPSTYATPYNLSLAVKALAPEGAARSTGGAVSLRPDTDAYKDGFSSFLRIADQLVSQYNMSMAYGLQPVTSTTVSQSERNGGLPLNLAPGSQTWFVGTISWLGSALDGIAQAALQNITQGVEQAARKHNVSMPFRFMNDANSQQNVLGSYGNASLSRLLAVSKAYDAKGIFQKQQNSGFLLRNAI